MKRLTASKSTAVDDEPPAQSLGFTSSSSISQSGLIKSALPANEDRAL
jgi:hypothetical protein